MGGADVRSDDDEGQDAAKRQRRFGGGRDDVRAVRSFVGRAAVDAGVDVDAAMLAASEVATNVILHAETSFDVAIEVGRGRLRVELSDGSAILPAVAHLVWSDSEHGRGMRIVEAVTSRWGTDLASSGKVVWFELEGGGTI